MKETTQIYINPAEELNRRNHYNGTASISLIAEFIQTFNESPESNGKVTIGRNADIVFLLGGVFDAGVTQGKREERARRKRTARAELTLQATGKTREQKNELVTAVLDSMTIEDAQELIKAYKNERYTRELMELIKDFAPLELAELKDYIDRLKAKEQ